MDSRYFEVVTVADTHTVTYKREKYHPWIMLPMALLAGFVGIVISGFLGGPALFFIFTILLDGGVFLLLNWLRKPGVIVIDNSTITVKKKSYSRSYLKELYVTAPVPAGPNLPFPMERYEYDEKGKTTPEIIGHKTTGAVSAFVQIIVNIIKLILGAAAKLIRKETDKKNYRICFHNGRKRITIASGLTMDAAAALFNRLSAL